MDTTLTIRNLPEPVSQRLRMQAASHGRSLEAEAREILTVSLAKGPEAILPPRSKEELQERLLAITGIWKDRTGGKTTDEIMKELRGDD